MAKEKDEGARERGREGATLRMFNNQQLDLANS